MIPETNSLLESLWPFIKTDWCKTKFTSIPLKLVETDSPQEIIKLKRIAENFQLPKPLPAIKPNLILEIPEEKEKTHFFGLGIPLAVWELYCTGFFSPLQQKE